MKAIATSLLLTLLPPAIGAQQHSFTILTNQPRQQIQHFGASDAWSMQYIGLWDNDAEQQRIADWLFSTENDSTGKPRGIGLSIWRFNLGAGSAEQGRSAQINSSTRTECFLNADGTYDWSRQAGQRRFMRMARQRGVPYLLAFINSAPVFFTQNGLATNTGRGGNINLRAECFVDFARFMATALRGLQEHDSLTIDYLSPVNEPDGHWNWQGPKQEGSPATNREIARLARLTSQELQRQGIATQILLNESSDLRCLLGVYKTSWERGNTVRTLFSPDSADTYIADVPQVLPVVAAHSYWTNTPLPYMRSIRQQLRDTLSHYRAGYWQTELCIMSNDEEIGGGGGYDFTMKTALYVARVIHHDLVFADAQSWSWWRAVGGDYKDGLIRAYGGLSPRDRLTDGRIRSGRAVDSRLLWALGNYSRFIRPGAVRHEVEASKPFNPYDVMCSAFRNADGSWVVVAINYGEQSQIISLAMSGEEAHSRKWTMYRTSDAEGETLKPVGTAKGQASLPARSITTFVSR